MNGLVVWLVSGTALVVLGCTGDTRAPAPAPAAANVPQPAPASAGSVEAQNRTFAADKLSQIAPRKRRRASQLGPMPPGHPPVNGVGGPPVRTSESPQPSRTRLEGTVRETLSAGRYTYLSIDTGKSDPVWAAVPACEIETGSSVTIVDAVRMQGFRSRSLNRVFPVVWFGVRAGDAQPAAADGSRGVITIAMVHRQAPTLEGASVTVHGKVTKVTRGVLGKNWLHLQDGSGDATRGTHDLVIATTADTQLDASVAATGVLVRDRDLGSGYRFAVMIDDAVLTAP